MTVTDLAAGAGLSAALAALAVIDARTFRLPDVLTLPLIAAGLAFALVSGAGIWLHVLGAGLGYLSLVAVEVAYRRLRGRDGLGRGDAKLFAAGGAWCGAAALPLILLAASASALLFIVVLRLFRPGVGATTMIAFGPFLAFGIWIVWISQNAL